MAARLTAVAVALIVGVTLVAGLIVGAQRDDDTGPIDLLIYNGRVYTGDASAPFAEAVAIRGNRIYRVGSNREIKRLRRRATTVIDAHGGSVLPGFSDAHARLPVVPEPPVASTASPAAPSVASGAPAAPHAPVTARAAASDVPAPAAKPEASSIVRDAIEGAHRLGVTGLNTVAEGPELAAYETLRRDDQLPLRVVAALRVTAPIDAATLDRLDAVRAAHANDPVFRVDAAALRVTLPPPAARATGRRARKAAAAEALPTDISAAVNALDQHGWNVVLQVDDERGLSAALDALNALSAAPAANRERRHRVELSRPMALDVPRIKALGIAVSLPLPATWAPGHALVADASGTETPAAGATATAAEPASTVASHSGLRLLMASEALADPRLGLQALLASPESSDGAPPSTEPVAEAALAAAIDAYTTTAAWASGDERRRGAIARDMLADIVILSADLFTLSADKLLDAVVTVTIFDGKVVYDREADAPHSSTDQ
jgi:predicted amidohydrolase YtcJ